MNTSAPRGQSPNASERGLQPGPGVTDASANEPADGRTGVVASLAGRSTISMTTLTAADRAAYAAGWKASRRSTTYDLGAAEARYERTHDDPHALFSAGWVDFAADRPYGFSLSEYDPSDAQSVPTATLRGAPTLSTPSADTLAGLANAHLLRVIPGRITAMREDADTLTVESVLDSPFADHTPSKWRTVFSRIDGETLSVEVTEKSLPR